MFDPGNHSRLEQGTAFLKSPTTNKRPVGPRAYGREEWGFASIRMRAMCSGRVKTDRHNSCNLFAFHSPRCA
jgi:hypothetical protein